jgi:hypothetical protein
MSTLISTITVGYTSRYDIQHQQVFIRKALKTYNKSLPIITPTKQKNQ